MSTKSKLKENYKSESEERSEEFCFGLIYGSKDGYNHGIVDRDSRKWIV